MSNKGPSGDLAVSVRTPGVQHSVIMAIEGLQNAARKQAAATTDTATTETQSVVSSRLFGNGSWLTGLSGSSQFDGAGGVNAAASGASGASYIGALGNRALYYLPTSVLVPVGFGERYSVVANARVIEFEASGTLPAAGGLVGSFDVGCVPVMSSAAYAPGGDPNPNTDVLRRAIGDVAVGLELSVSVSDLAPNLTGLTATLISWEIYVLESAP